MFFGMGCTPSVIQAADCPLVGLSAAPNALVELVKYNSRGAARKRSLEDIEGPANVRLDKGASRVRSHVRFVQRRRMYA